MDIVKTIQDKYPGWIQHDLVDYAEEYNHFSTTWDKLCDMLTCSRQRLLLVEYVEAYVENMKPDDATAIHKGCDALTAKGFCIRRTTEFQPCANQCDRAIPTPELHAKLLTHPHLKHMIPSTWQTVCIKCRTLSGEAND